MKVIDLGKEQIDIEIQGSNYRLSGEISCKGFTAWENGITRIGLESVPISINERMKLASNMQPSTSEEFISWLKDPAVSINSNLGELTTVERETVMKKVCKEWDDTNLEITFVDKQGKFLCRT